MAEDREQLDKFMELLGEGSARWIRMTVLFALALSGIVLQGLVHWYAIQVVGNEWGTLGIQIWAVAVGAWMLIVVIGLARLRKHRKDMQKGRPSERKTGPTLHNDSSANLGRDGEIGSGFLPTDRPAGVSASLPRKASKRVFPNRRPAPTGLTDPDGLAGTFATAPGAP